MIIGNMFATHLNIIIKFAPIQQNINEYNSQTNPLNQKFRQTVK